MMADRSCETEATTSVGDSIELELCFDGLFHRFELASDDTRALTVGSLPRADLRIEAPGVAPVHFHLERDGNEVWIVPAYGAHDLRVDTARITGPKCIDGRAVIEFAGIRVDVRVVHRDSVVIRNHRELDPPNTRREGPPLPVGDSLPTTSIERVNVSERRGMNQPTESVSFGALGLPLSAQRTIAIEPVRVTPKGGRVAESAVVTVNTEREPIDKLTPKDGAYEQRVGAQDTIEIAPFWVRQLESKPLTVERTEAVPPLTREPATTLELCASAEDVASQPSPNGQSAVTTYFEPIRVSDVSLQAVDIQEPQSKMDPDIAPPASNANERRRPNWLAHLGQLTSRKPLFVWTGGTLLAFTFSAAISFGIRQFVHPSSTRQTTQLLPTPITASASKSPTEETSKRMPVPSLEVIPAVAEATLPIRKKGQPHDPQLTAAVGSLVAGRYNDAERAYAGVVARVPIDLALVAMSKLLAKKTGPRCTGTLQNPAVTCPEVKP